MKKIVVLLLVLAMALSLFACGKENNEPQTTTAAATKAQETEPSVQDGNDLPDDGLNWSPLVPVE